MITDDQSATLKAKLRALETDCNKTLAQGRVSSQTVELDQTVQGRLSRMDAMQGQAMAQAAVRRNELRLKQIAAALRRLDADEYGDCMDCGCAIPYPRLEFDPCATRCVDCAEQQER